jgi:hypothetical protein
MKAYQEYRKKATQLLRHYSVGEDMTGVSISVTDEQNGSPKVGDMIAVSRDDKTDLWLVSKDFFDKNYELAV